MGYVQANACHTMTIDTHDEDSVVLPKLENIEVFGLNFTPNLNAITLDNQPISNVDPSGTSYSTFTKVMNITASPIIDFAIGGPLWTLFVPISSSL
uniref:BPI2 domain-containing protein n=1 Tax=Panagrellus redivivus TaxID=6233 RepID=A0A7E4VMN2_PANRE